MGMAIQVVERVGSSTLGGLRSVGSTARFVGETAGGIRDLGTWPSQTLLQARRLGVGSLRRSANRRAYGAVWSGPASQRHRSALRPLAIAAIPSYVIAYTLFLASPATTHALRTMAARSAGVMAAVFLAAALRALRSFRKTPDAVAVVRRRKPGDRTRILRPFTSTGVVTVHGGYRYEHTQSPFASSRARRTS